MEENNQTKTQVEVAAEHTSATAAIGDGAAAQVRTARAHKRQPVSYHLRRMFFIVLGSLIFAVGLEIFLVPNSIIDGGITGISILLGHLTGLPIGLFLFVLNLPFLLIGYKQIGRTFAVTTLIGVAFMSVFVSLLVPVEALTVDPLLAAVFGGVLMGIGVGTIIRYGGSLDGTEIVAILLTRKLPFSVGEIVMFFNIFILGSAGFVFGWDHAMYSLIAYYIAFKMIDITVEGLDQSKSVTIIAESPEDISDAIQYRLGRGVTHIYGKGGYSGEDKELLYVIVTRLELAKLKSIVLEIDPQAFIAIEHVSDVTGGRFRKKAIH
ncbi:YitT family protein [Tumebacillus flagellatus]|uniref:Membrane protein n=1 Tax=Tumebacillus flagellatus TaxID=1157490 RepID=A0A074LTR9_9BACL|nr:YitT family protein [Tumebacillus flagellatus]KEO84529.1 membrane protein [Tumebacillus flagellatus]